MSIDYPEGMPRWAPGAADHLASLLTGKEITVEWGGGWSSVWLADKVCRLHVIEHDPKWVKFIEKRTDRSKVKTWLRSWEIKGYVEIMEHAGSMIGRPDLWLIDGFRRIDCLAVVEQRVKPGNIVVLDDALDYAEHLLGSKHEITRFAVPHPNAGTKLNLSRHKVWRNSVRTHHAETKETWIVRWAA